MRAKTPLSSSSRGACDLAVHVHTLIPKLKFFPNYFYPFLNGITKPRAGSRRVRERICPRESMCWEKMGFRGRQGPARVALLVVPSHRLICPIRIDQRKRDPHQRSLPATPPRPSPPPGPPPAPSSRPVRHLDQTIRQVTGITAITNSYTVASSPPHHTPPSSFLPKLVCAIYTKLGALSSDPSCSNQASKTHSHEHTNTRTHTHTALR